MNKFLVGYGFGIAIIETINLIRFKATDLEYVFFMGLLIILFGLIEKEEELRKWN